VVKVRRDCGLFDVPENFDVPLSEDLLKAFEGEIPAE